ncbi:MAG: hypothetical protein JSS43_10290 [Proteobacteria bacterium]|nr:hypothetical protein [Pseudomonadota bacterium]
MSRTGATGDGLSRLVYQILVVERKCTIRDTAEAAGMEYPAFHARVIGRTHFKAEEVPALIRALPDPRLCDYLLEQTDFMAVARPPQSTKPEKNVFEAALEVSKRALDVIEAIGTAGSDPAEAAMAARLAGLVVEVERTVGRLRASIDLTRGGKSVLLGTPSLRQHASTEIDCAAHATVSDATEPPLARLG